MSDQIMLPFSVPTYATVQDIAGVGLAVACHPTAYNQILNQTVSLTCRKDFLRGYTSPTLTVTSPHMQDYSCLERYGVSLRHTYPVVHEIIKKMLQEGYYVHYSCVDDYYLPGKSWYGTRHLHHDGVICGYDESDRSYSIAAYDINWVYNLIRVPQDCFMEGLKASIDEKRYGILTALKAAASPVALDETQILRRLKECLEMDIDRYSMEPTGEVVGIAVYDFLSMYIGKLLDGSIPYEKMDWRALRPVWEHKKCMVDRIEAIEKKHNWSSELSLTYAPLIEDANRLRMLYALYHQKRRDGLLPVIQKGLSDLKEKDKALLQKLISKMEEAKI